MRYLKFATLLLSLMIASLSGAAEHNPLLPRPQKIQYGSGRLLVRGLGIRFASSPNAADRFGAMQLSKRLKELTGLEVPVWAGTGGGPAIVLDRTDAADHPLPMPDERPGPESREAYHLTVTPTGAEIRGRSSAAVFYGIQTLCQMVEGKGEAAALPEVKVDDWPSLAYRMTMWDLSQGFRSTEEEVKRQIDFIARWKGNQYGFFTEDSIKLDGYGPWDSDPAICFTKNQVRDIIGYARQRHIDVVPFFELLAHEHDLFRLERYADLAAYRYGADFNPNNPKAKTLLANWAEQLTQLFPSPFVHIGFDEAGEMVRVAREEGGGTTPASLFLGQLKFVAGLFKQRGKRVMIWGDMLSKVPEIAPQLPRGVIIAVWWYNPSPDPEYKEWMKPVVDGKLPFFVSTEVGSNCNRIGPNFQVGFENIDTFLAVARKYKALGLINTIWGNNPGQALMRQCWPGVAYGEVASWQTRPVDRSHFLLEYAQQMYGLAIAPDVAQGLEDISQSEVSLEKVLGGETALTIWDDPFRPYWLKAEREHRNDLHESRLLAENAEEHFDKALDAGGDPEALNSLLYGSRMLDYAGMKYLYALHMNEAWDQFRQQKEDSGQKAGWHPDPAVNEMFGWGVISWVNDLMNTIMDLRQEFLAEWPTEYAPYRKGRAAAQFNLEYAYWNRAQARYLALKREYKPGESLPPLGVFVGACSATCGASAQAGLPGHNEPR